MQLRTNLARLQLQHKSLHLLRVQRALTLMIAPRRSLTGTTSSAQAHATAAQMQLQHHWCGAAPLNRTHGGQRRTERPLAARAQRALTCT
jgi:hypothetical protein